MEAVCGRRPLHAQSSRRNHMVKTCLNIEEIFNKFQIRSSRHGHWVTGGEGSDGVPLATTEFSQRPGRIFKPGPKLPVGISRHCLIRIEESPILVNVS